MIKFNLCYILMSHWFGLKFNFSSNIYAEAVFTSGEYITLLDLFKHIKRLVYYAKIAHSFNTSIRCLTISILVFVQNLAHRIFLQSDSILIVVTVVLQATLHDVVFFSS